MQEEIFNYFKKSWVCPWEKQINKQKPLEGDLLISAWIHLSWHILLWRSSDKLPLKCTVSFQSSNLIEKAHFNCLISGSCFFDSLSKCHARGHWWPWFYMLYRLSQAAGAVQTFWPQMKSRTNVRPHSIIQSLINITLRYLNSNSKISFHHFLVEGPKVLLRLSDSHQISVYHLISSHSPVNHLKKFWRLWL